MVRMKRLVKLTLAAALLAMLGLAEALKIAFAVTFLLFPLLTSAEEPRKSYTFNNCGVMQISSRRSAIVVRGDQASGLPEKAMSMTDTDCMPAPPKSEPLPFEAKEGNASTVPSTKKPDSFAPWVTVPK